MLRLLTRLVLLFALGFFAPGEAAARVVTCAGLPELSAAETRVVGECPELAVLHQTAAMQAAEMQQGSASHSYEVASIYSLAAETAAAPTGEFYSAAYEMKLDSSVLGRARGVHFNRANAALDAALNSDPAFAAQMEELIPGVQDAVSSVGGRETPSGWIWHHEIETGVMRLVPEAQHTPGSIFWDTLHPGGSGGYSIWAIPAGAPPN